MCSLSVTTNILKTMETSSSVGMFARDTGDCLISRLGLSRTKNESREISFAELTESAIFYFSAPAAAKGFADVYSKAFNVNKDTMTTPVKSLQNIDGNMLKRVKLGKFSQIVTTFGLILPLVYGIAQWP